MHAGVVERVEDRAGKMEGVGVGEEQPIALCGGGAERNREILAHPALREGRSVDHPELGDCRR
jgi:hypothetical protein